MKTLGILLLTTLSAVAADPKVVGGPMAVNVTNRSVTIVWIVQSDQAAVTGADGKDTRLSPSLRVEKTTLTGLASNTHYDYKVAGQTGSFKTPPNGAGSFSFVLYGDNRTRHDVHQKVMETLLKNASPDFVLQTGDMVENGSDDSLWPIFFDIEKDLLRKAAIFPALGNHERNSRDFYEFFQATMPYYSFNWG